jgi:Fic family protein
MDEKQFSVEQRRNLTKTVDGAWAFIPPPLPPQLNLSEIALPLAAASSAVGELNGAARRLQNPYMLMRALTRKEALTSSAMEGTITTIGNIVRQEAEPTSGMDDNAREAFNYLAAMVAANNQMTKLPISHRVIKDAHANLLSGLSPLRGAGKRPGEYKLHQNAVGQLGETVHTARYVPPPPKDTLACMDALEAFINKEQRQQGEKLIDIALMHYQFEAIHPFDDGNGRIGRMLVTLMAQQTGLVALPLLHISSYLETRKEEYIEKLFSVSTQGRWAEWISFFLAAVQASCLASINVVDRLITLQAAMKHKIRQAGANHRLATIIDELFTNGWTTVTKTEKLCGITFPTAQSDLKVLVKLGLVEETQSGRPTIYYAPEILRLSDRDDMSIALQPI